MKEKFLNDSINLITRYNNTYTEDDIDKIKYGLEGLYLTVTKLIIISIIEWLLTTCLEIMIHILSKLKLTNSLWPEKYHQPYFQIGCCGTDK